MRYLGIARKTAAILANVSLFLNTFLPFLVAIQPVYANDPEVVAPPIVENTPTPEPVISVQPTPENTPTVEPTPTSEVTPTIVPTPENTPAITPTIVPNPESTPEATPTIVPTIAPTSVPENNNQPANQENNQNNNSAPSPTVEPTSTPENTEPAEVPTPTITPVIEQICLTEGESIKDTTEFDWNYNLEKDLYETKEKVKLGVKYIFPQDNNVTVTFKCLPTNESLLSTLKIKRVKTSDLNLPDNTTNVGEYAYDITTDMMDGIFKYDITLPKTSDNNAGIAYIEKSIDAAKLGVLDSEIKSISDTEQQTDKVVGKEINHFTIFIVTGVWPTTSNNGIVSGEGTAQIRWPNGGGQKSGLGFVGASGLNLENLTSNGNAFTLGTLTHYNYPVSSAIIWADLKITLELSTPKDFTFRVQIDETENDGSCPYGGSGQNCNDKVTFPDSISDQIVTVGGIEYTLIIDGFQRTVGGVTLDSFITEEYEDNVAYLVGHFTPVGRIIVDKVTNPVSDNTSFAFTATGAGYNSFSLTDVSTPNNQVLPANRTYSVGESIPSGWNQTSVNCVSSIGDTEVATALELDSGETITCTFSNTSTVCKAGTPSLEGKIKNGNYTTGNLCAGAGDCWSEGEDVPARITIPGMIVGRNYSVTIQHDYSLSGTIGYEYFYNALSSNGSADNISLGAATNTNCGGGVTCKNYVLNFIAQSTTVQLDWLARLSNQAGNWSGASLHYRLTVGPCGGAGNKDIPINPGKIIKLGSITVTKSTNNNANPNDWSFNITGNTNVQNLSSGSTASNLSLGANNGDATYTITEVGPTNSWFLESVSGDCTKTSDTTASVILTSSKPDVSCTFINKSKTGHLIVQKTTVPSNDPTIFDINLLDSTGTIVDTSTVTDSLDKDYEVVAGTYSVNENILSGWAQTSNTCVGVTVPAGQNVYCSIENKKLPVLTIEKVLVGDTSPYTNFSFQLDNGTATPFESDGTNQIYVVPGQTYNITEVDPGSNYNVSYSAGCSGNLTYNQTATCTITNTKYGSLTIVKNSTPDSSQSFSFTTSGTGLSNFSLADDGNVLHNTKVFSNLLPGTYSVTEFVTTGWDQNSVVCTDGSSNTAINLSAGENITCTFTNTMRGAIGGHKYHDIDGNILTTGDRDPVSNWNITLVNNDTGTSAFTTTDQNGSYSFTNLIPGSYTLTEGSRSGWYNSGSQSINVTLTPGQNNFGNDFINTQFASILVYKNVDTDGDGDIDETHSTNWKWNIIKDSVSTEYSTGATASSLYPGLYTISEQQKSGYFITSLICNNGTAGADNSYGAVESQTVTLSSGQNLVCTFTNTKINPVINIVKTSTTTSIASVGQTVPYTFEVTNTGNQILTGITVTDTKCNTNPVYQSGDTNSDSKLDLSERWVYSCNHTVTQSEIDAGGNLRNTATVDSNESNPDTDTKDIPITQDPKFTVTKSADVSSVDNTGDVINYTITVTNTGNQTLTGVSVNDPLLSNLDCDPSTFGYQHTGLSINVGAYLTCVGGYTVTQTDINNYGGGDGDIDNTVTADTNQTDSKTADESVLINGSITVIKTDNLNSGTDFTFNYTIGNSAPTQFVLDDDNNSNNTHLDQIKFSNLSPNTYSIGESSTPGWSSAMVQCISNYSLDGYQQYSPSLGAISTDLRQGENLICTFSNTRDTGSLTINKIIDLDGDLTTTADQVPGSNWEFDADGNSSNTDDPSADYTDINGTKVFSNLRTGLYNIIETKQTGYDLISANCGERNGTFDTIDSVDNASVNKGANTVCTFYNTPNSTIHGYKWGDLDGDRLFDDGESLLSDWTINLYRAIDGEGYESTPFRSMTTSSGSDHFGWYWFEHLLPGNYKVCEVPQVGWRQISPTNDGCHLINLPSQSSGSFNSDNVELPIYNFSNQQLAVVNVTKFSDLNGNGRQDSGENNLSGWTINLSGQTSVVTNVNGSASFTNLIPGNYTISENLQTGWRQTNIVCDQEEGTYNDNSHQITLTSGQTLNCKVANQQLSNLTVYKFNDLNGNGQKDSGEEVLSNWMINLTDQTSLTTDSQGQVRFNNLIPGEYDLSENLSSQPGWHQTNIYCEDQSEGVMITKPGEAYGHHGWCQGWNDCKDAATCALWACRARGYSTLVSNGEGKACNSGLINNCHLFNSSEPPILSPNGSYIDNQYVDYNWGTSCGVMGVTDIVCSNGGSNSNQGNGSYTSGSHLNFTSGNNKVCYIGNQRLEPKTTITKSNNSGGAELNPGNSVEYTINVNFTDNSVNNLKVTDLLSNGFKYRPGSYKVYKNNEDKTSSVPEPEYHSPGVWNLSDLGVLTPSDVVKLVYIADISTDQQAGKYADLAWSIANYSYDSSKTVLALAGDEGKVNTNFVGTEVAVGGNYQNSVSAEVEQVNHTTGQVLGASTELPGTGAATIWLIISGLLSLVGFGFIKFNKKTMLTILLALLSFGLIVSPVRAETSNLSVRLEEPKTPSRVKEIELKYVALDIQGRGVTAYCLKKGPTDSGFVQFSSETLSGVSGNASHCSLVSAITDNGSYQFQVKAIAGGEESYSNTVSLDYNTSVPGTPVDYRKEQINNCDFKIHFKTDSDNGKTVKVELYRSTDSNFSANNESLVVSTNIGSNQEKDILNSVPDCSKTYYYALRAFDSAGNGSGLVGDKVYTTVTDGTTTITSTTTNTGAIPVNGSNISPDNVDQDNQDSSTNQSDNQSTGQILGSETQSGNIITRHKFAFSIIVVVLLAIIIYVFKKVRKNKKRSSKR